MASFSQMLDDLKGHNELNLYNVKGTNIFKHGIIQMLKKSSIFTLNAGFIKQQNIMQYEKEYGKVYKPK